MQETYIRAWAGFDSFQPGSNLRAWMFRIMVNTWISAHRRSQRRPQETLTDSITDAQLMAESGRRHTAPSAEAKPCSGFPNGDLARAFQALPNRCSRPSTTPTCVSSRTRRSPTWSEFLWARHVSAASARRQLRAALTVDAEFVRCLTPARDLDDGVGECLRCLLRHVVPDAVEDAVRVLAR